MDSSKTGLIESEQNEPASSITTENEQDYRQYLYRLFGKETAEYFLCPSSDDHTEPSAWYHLLMEHMGERVSAVALWEALRENSASTLAKQEEEATYKKVKQLHVDWEHQRERGHLSRLAGVRRMFRLAQLRQALSAQLLDNKAPVQPNDSR